MKVCKPTPDSAAICEAVQRRAQAFRTGEKILPDPAVITLEEGQLPQVVDKCEALLMRSDLAPEHRLFQRGGQLVRIISLPSSGHCAGVERPKGAVIIRVVDRVYVQDVLGRLSQFQRRDARKKTPKSVDVPKSVAEMLLARTGLWKFPSLRGILLSPTVRADGSLLEKEGYDAASGFYLAAPLKIKVPAEPTRAEAVAALDGLDSLLVEFSFVSDVDKAVALALMLTAITRPAFENVPLFAVTAPVRGSGKSTLVDIASIFATGRRAAVVAAVSDPDELRKRLESCLLAGDSMVSLDNLNGILNSDLLCQATTQAAVKVRPLGVSTQMEVPNTAVFCANGNNLTIGGDLSRRTLMCKLDPKMERPEERVFKHDAIGLATARRVEYVSAALTIMRAYAVAGMPSQGLSRFGSFEGWSDLVRSSLVWAGTADPCESRSAIIADDPELAQLESVLTAWFAKFKSTPTTVQEVVYAATQDDNLGLAESISNVAEVKGFINRQKFGIWCRRNQGRIAGGHKLLRSERTGASAHWRVVDA